MSACADADCTLASKNATKESQLEALTALELEDEILIQLVQDQAGPEGLFHVHWTGNLVLRVLDAAKRLQARPMVRAHMGANLQTAAIPRRLYTTCIQAVRRVLLFEPSRGGYGWAHSAVFTLHVLQSAGVEAVPAGGRCNMERVSEKWFTSTCYMSGLLDH